MKNNEMSKNEIKKILKEEKYNFIDDTIFNNDDVFEDIFNDNNSLDDILKDDDFFDECLDNKNYEDILK